MLTYYMHTVTFQNITFVIIAKFRYSFIAARIHKIIHCNTSMYKLYKAYGNIDVHLQLVAQNLTAFDTYLPNRESKKLILCKYTK